MFFSLFRCGEKRASADFFSLWRFFWGVVTSLVGTMNPWNCGYEGSRPPPGLFLQKVRNGFLSNVLVFTFDHAPRGAVSRFLIDRVYGRDIAFPYLYVEYENRHDAEGIKRVIRCCENWDSIPSASR